MGEEPRTTSPTNEAYPLLEPSTVSYRTLAAHQRFHNQPSAIRINAVASMPAKTAPIIGQTAINFARCERGPRSTHAARRHGSKYFSQSHAAAHPPINKRMNNKSGHAALIARTLAFDRLFLTPALLRSACFADTSRATIRRIKTNRNTDHFSGVKRTSCKSPRMSDCPKADMGSHPALMPAALMIGHHFSISAFCNLPSASGVCWSAGGIASPWSA